jgi:hypothetical protein
MFLRVEKGLPVTTFIQRTLPTPTPAGGPLFAGLFRFARSVADAGAYVLRAIDFAHAMEAARTPAARQAVLDRFPV